jgi:hypothetical protein
MYPRPNCSWRRADQPAIEATFRKRLQEAAGRLGWRPHASDRHPRAPACPRQFRMLSPSWFGAIIPQWLGRIGARNQEIIRCLSRASSLVPYITLAVSASLNLTRALRPHTRAWKFITPLEGARHHKQSERYARAWPGHARAAGRRGGRRERRPCCDRDHRGPDRRPRGLARAGPRCTTPKSMPYPSRIRWCKKCGLPSR